MIPGTRAAKKPRWVRPELKGGQSSLPPTSAIPISTVIIAVTRAPVGVSWSIYPWIIHDDRSGPDHADAPPWPGIPIPAIVVTIASVSVTVACAMPSFNVDPSDELNV